MIMKRFSISFLVCLVVGLVCLKISTVQLSAKDTSTRGRLGALQSHNYKFTRREKVLYDHCVQRSNLTSSSRLNWLSENSKNLQKIIVNDKYKALYCYVPKVACTNWKRIFYLLKDNPAYSRLEDLDSDSVHRQDVFTTLNTLKAPEIEYRLNSYNKIIFVRHPIERLISAFRNKFEKNYTSSIYFKTRFGVKILKKYRKRLPNNIDKTGDGVKFSEFIQYILDTNRLNPELLNEHWTPVSTLCHPCVVRYNLIGKYSSLKVDADAILQTLNVPNNLKFPDYKPSSTHSFLKKYIKLLDKGQLEDLITMYRDDFILFSYSLTSFSNK